MTAQLALDFAAMLDAPVPPASFPNTGARSGSTSDPIGRATGAASESGEPVLVAPSDRYLPAFGRIVASCLEAGDRVTVHYWREQAQRSAELALSTPGLELERRGWRVGTYAVPWCAAFYVESKGEAGYSHYADPARLYMMPVKLARELLASALPGWRHGDSLDLAREQLSAAVSMPRDEWELVDSLMRALQHPERFNGTHFAPSFIEQLESRADATAAKLREWPGASEVPQAYRGREGESEHNATCRRQLLDLQPGERSYINGVSVQRVPCAGYWWEVCVREDCEHCGETKPDRWGGAFSYCIECVKLVCSDCRDRHVRGHLYAQQGVYIDDETGRARVVDPRAMGASGGL